MTVIEHKGRYKDINIVWVGDGNNVSHSWINAAAVLGLNLNLACPEGYFPDRKILEKALGKGVGKIVVTSDPVEAVKDADVIYTDIWASMGQERELSSRRHVFEPFQINEALLKNAPDDVILMHCLPAHRGGMRLAKRSSKVPVQLFGTSLKTNLTCTRPYSIYC